MIKDLLRDLLDLTVTMILSTNAGFHFSDGRHWMGILYTVMAIVIISLWLNRKIKGAK